MTARESSKRFSIAFSYASERAELVHRIAEAVAAQAGRERVFLDSWCQDHLAGECADLKLQKIMRRDSEVVVVCISGEYGRKGWTLVEFDAIRARQLEARGAGFAGDLERIFYIRVGDGDVPEILPTTVLFDGLGQTPEASAMAIMARLRGAEASGRTTGQGDPDSRQPPTAEETRAQHASAVRAGLIEEIAIRLGSEEKRPLGVRLAARLNLAQQEYEPRALARTLVDLNPRDIIKHVNCWRSPRSAEFWTGSQAGGVRGLTRAASPAT